MLRCFDLSLRLDADVPLATRLADGEVPRFTEEVLRFAVAHPTKFRQFDTSVVVVCLETLRDPKTLSLTFLLELGKIGTLLKKVCVRTLKIAAVRE
jgi:hypothetical protein